MKETAETAIRGLAAELELIGEDPAALSVAARAEAWRGLRSRYDTAKDIPVRRSELDGKRDAVAEILRRLGRPGEAEPQRLILSVRTVGGLEELIAQRSGVLAKLETARVALDDAKSALGAALAEAPESDGGGAAFEALKSRLQVARRDDLAARLRSARTETDKLARKLADALAALAPWQGQPEDAGRRHCSQRSGNGGAASTDVAGARSASDASPSSRRQEWRSGTIEGGSGGRRPGSRTRRRRRRRGLFGRRGRRHGPPIARR